MQSFCYCLSQGDHAHCGFPEIAYDRYANVVIVCHRVIMLTVGFQR